MPVSLCLHELDFKLIFLPILRSDRTSVSVVHHSVSEIIEAQILDLLGVAIKEMQILGRRHMVILIVVRRSEHFHTIPWQMAVEAHKHARQGNVVGRNETFEFAVVHVPEWRETWGPQERIVVVHCDHRVHFVG